jgi:hypothetical protein
MYIKVLMYMFFYMALGLTDFGAENPLLGPLEGVGPEMATSEASAIWARKKLLVAISGTEKVSIL